MAEETMLGYPIRYVEMEPTPSLIFGDLSAYRGFIAAGPGALTEEQKEEFRRQWAALHSGPRDKGDGSDTTAVPSV